MKFNRCHDEILDSSGQLHAHMISILIENFYRLTGKCGWTFFQRTHLVSNSCLHPKQHSMAFTGDLLNPPILWQFHCRLNPRRHKIKVGWTAATPDHTPLSTFASVDPFSHLRSHLSAPFWLLLAPFGSFRLFFFSLSRNEDHSTIWNIFSCLDDDGIHWIHQKTRSSPFPNFLIFYSQSSYFWLRIRIPV